jgi:NAD(P)-dependent dehydrogenase (short-subunit alcohol dehydrogenase family)
MTRLQTQNLPTRIKTIKKLEGKIAVIAGGNSGRGLATAQRFVADGAHVFITSRRQSDLMLQSN